MLAKAYRLSRPEFNEYFKRGQRIHTDVATIIFTPSPTFKVSVVVGKKVSKQAVERNRLRRQVYGIFDAMVATDPTSITGVYIIILKPAARTCTRTSLRTTLTTSLARLGNTR